MNANRYRADMRFPYSGDSAASMIRDTTTGLVVEIIHTTEIMALAVKAARDNAAEAADRMNQGHPFRYVVKCDDCKVTIRATDNARESYAGGRCAKCRGAK